MAIWFCWSIYRPTLKRPKDFQAYDIRLYPGEGRLKLRNLGPMPITELRVFAYGYGYASFPGGGTSLPLRLEPGEEALIEFNGPWTGGRVRLRVTAVFLDGGAVSHEYKGYVYYYPP